MIICHQCGHSIVTSAIQPEVICPKCQTKYITKPHKRPTPPFSNQNNKPLVENPYENSQKREANNDERTIIHDNVVNPSPPIPKPGPPPFVTLPKVGLKFWGTFDLSFLEQIKSLTMPNAYQKELIVKSMKDGRKAPIFYIPKNKVLLGRKPTNLEGFEDVDIKLDSQDISISRRQCVIEIIVQNNQTRVEISTHAMASNPVEINGRQVEKSQKRMIYNGEFIRIGNSIFEIVIENSQQDINKTILF